MSVWIAPLPAVDDWKHVEDRTEPPEERDGKTCGDCDNFEPCPSMSCRWGICRAELDRWDGGNLDAWASEDHEADECKDFEEA